MPQELPAWGTPEWCKFVPRNKLAFDSLPAGVFTADGLIRCSDLIRVSTASSYTLWIRQHDNVCVAANSYSCAVADYLATDPNLWSIASIRVVSGRGISGRALMRGVPFRKALLVALERGNIKSEFFLPHQQDDVFYAALIFHVNRRKESNGSTIELQAWQYCPGLSEVFYIHAESPDFSDYVTHFDGAIIHFAPDQITQLFRFCNKIKSESYEKQFRLDGQIPIGAMFCIVSSYLPVTELVDEAFECRDFTIAT